MHLPAILAAALAASTAAAKPLSSRASDTNPFINRELFASSIYAKKLDQTVQSFTRAGDTTNAARARTAQTIGTFSWITSIAAVKKDIPSIVAEARAAQTKTGKTQIIGLVLYNLPDRDCSGGQSSGELSSASGGLSRYKSEFVDAYAAELSKASDMQFAVVLEPDSLANVVTSSLAFCKNAASTYEQGIAYAIQKLQQANVALYIDAAHGSWLGQSQFLEPSKAPPNAFAIAATLE